MHLPIIQTTIRELQMMQSQWKTILDNILQNPLLAGLQISNVALITGNNTIPHKLGRQPQGYFLTGVDSAVTVYQVGSPNPTLTLVLNSSGSANISLWVY